ncbi:hypothetical protein Pst134EA_007518 [Puccinia striiformis f. sp. tritici]|uniref:hypothetical protein n=1 Tax=Puccinia striiformis f. sp. tritici TaxID=168172 RepID=UPI0020083FD4|nr:hypothetical protein Pst134EA_007518 [Puccinia striiformis f. sp. tritici]KAH9470252.1 hypothetical protein Pst134EA_007518 [Puccinia striiformis f. sp. tritici]
MPLKPINNPEDPDGHNPPVKWENVGLNGLFHSYKMREVQDLLELWYKVQYSQMKMKANANPQKLLDQILTNHKDIVLKEGCGHYRCADQEDRFYLPTRPLHQLTTNPKVIEEKQNREERRKQTDSMAGSGGLKVAKDE